MLHFVAQNLGPVAGDGDRGAAGGRQRVARKRNRKKMRSLLNLPFVSSFLVFIVVSFGKNYDVRQILSNNLFFGHSLPGLKI